jgi:type I restriction enzyme R subunit
MDTSEKNFEAVIEACLLRDPLAEGKGDAKVLAETVVGAYVSGGYHRREPSDYDRELCLIPKDVVGFISATQPREWQKMLAQHGADAKPLLLKRLASEVHKHASFTSCAKGSKPTAASSSWSISARRRG